MKDFFGFSSTQYREKLSAYPVERLQKKEVQLTRIIYGTATSTSISLGMAIPSAGLSRAGAGVGYRRTTVYERKLALVRERLTQLGIPLYEIRRSDKFIPAAAAVVGTVVGLGIDVGIGAAIASASADGVTQVATSTGTQVLSHFPIGLDGCAITTCVPIQEVVPVTYVAPVASHAAALMTPLEARLCSSAGRLAGASAMENTINYFGGPKQDGSKKDGKELDENKKFGE